MYEEMFPYIIKEGTVYWNLPYKSTSVEDFINTHDEVIKSGLTFETGYPMAGGPGLLDVIESWKTAWPVIKNFISETDWKETVGFLSSAIALVEWIRVKFIKRKKEPPYPNTFIEFIYTKNIWNHFELAKLLDITNDEAKTWLKALGYNWNKNIQAYEITDNVKDERLSKIDSINYLDK